MADRREHPYVIRFEAGTSYVYGCMSVAELAKELNVPETTMEKWAAKDAWISKRRRFRKELFEAGANLCALFNAMIRKALETKDLRDIAMVMKLEKLLSKYWQGDFDLQGLEAVAAITPNPSRGK